MVLSGCDWPGQYEGKTAKEWSEMYYSENTDKVNLQDEYDSLQSEKQSLQDSYDEMESENNDLQDTYDELYGCVEDYPHDAEYNCL